MLLTDRELCEIVFYDLNVLAEEEELLYQKVDRGVDSVSQCVIVNAVPWLVL
jgi:hypothetical protein